MTIFRRVFFSLLKKIKKEKVAEQTQTEGPTRNEDAEKQAEKEM